MHYKEVKAILSPQNGMNIYRGCTFGCVYCDARSKCYRIRHDFDDVEVKEKADDMLEKTLKRKRTRGMITTGAMTEPYLPLEEDLRMVRRCLNQIERFEFGLAIKTKSELILRDIDILEKINQKTKCVVSIPLCTADDKLSAKLEPGLAVTSARVKILKEFRDRGIPTIVWFEPMLPFIVDNEDNISELLAMCEDAGVYGIMCASIGILLRDGSRDYFFDNLDTHFPGLTERYQDAFGDVTELISPENDKLLTLIHKTCDRAGIVWDREELTRFMREYKNKTTGEQMSLFDFTS